MVKIRKAVRMFALRSIVVFLLVFGTHIAVRGIGFQAIPQERY
jgi:hypothetical protein